MEPIMKIRILIGIIAGIFALSAHSATLVVSGGQLMGATEVDVDGINYDVSFMDGSCISLFEGCTAFAFTNLGDAQAASQALLDQVFIGTFDTTPGLTNGIDIASPGFILTPFWTTGSLLIGSTAFNFLSTGSDFSLPTPMDIANDLTDAPLFTYAVWTAAVPVPAAAWLFMSAIVGLTGVKRASSSKRSL